jgi:hypothetical protein
MDLLKLADQEKLTEEINHRLNKLKTVLKRLINKCFAF